MEKAKKIKIETLPMSAGGKATKPPIKIEEKRGSLSPCRLKQNVDGVKRGSYKEGMKLVNFLDDLKEISKAESQNTKEIIKKLEKETEGFKDQKKAANKQNLENIMYTKEEIKKYTEEHGENVSKFYTFSQSGKEYFQKNLTKGMKKL